MKGRFEYLRPSTLREACELKVRYGAAARFLAGGTDLLLAWRRGKADFRYCIDLTFLPDLRYVQNDAKKLRIGALTTLAGLENASGTNGFVACLRRAVQQMCTPQLRTFATVGGNLSNASPAADLAVVFVAFGAQFRILGTKGEREVAAEEFFRGVNQTALADGELLVEVTVPMPEGTTGCGFSRVSRSVVDIAQANAAVCLTVGPDGTVANARVALGAVAPVPVRSREAEEILLGAMLSRVDPAVVDQAGRQAASDTRPISDMRASADYRREVSRVLVKRALEQALATVRGANK